MGRDIGCFAAWTDNKWEYVKRSFCIIELYAAVLGDCKLAIASPARNEKEAQQMLKAQLEPGEKIKTPGFLQEDVTDRWNGPIDAREAKTGIDGYVESMDGGFDRLNATATAEIIKAAKKFEDS